MPEELEDRLSSEPVIWFQGAYGRESHFGHWLCEWHSQGFAKSGFRETADVLLSGKTGPVLHAINFCHSLFPFFVVFEGFARFSGLSEATAGNQESLTEEKKIEINNWLMKTLSEIAESEDTLHNLSKDATLLDRLVKDRKLALGSLDDENQLRKLLSYFIPQTGGHASWYNPELDDDLRRLMDSTLKSSEIDRAVMKWLQRLKQIMSMLTNAQNHR